MATIFLDYDGTLHNSMNIYEPAFRQAYAWLVEQGYAEPRDFEFNEISYWLGFSTEEMWTTFMPSLERPVWTEASHIVGREMERITNEGGATLFEGVPETLALLKAQGHNLVFLSNCKYHYRDMHRAAFNLDRYFDEYYCAEQFDFIPKWQIYQQIKNRHEDTPEQAIHVMVGDRFHDIDVAARAGIPSVGAAYGFATAGELDSATMLIDSFGQLPAALEKLLVHA